MYPTPVNILATVRSLPAKSMNGTVCVPFTDIVRACSVDAHGAHMVSAKLESLEVEGKVTLFRMDSSNAGIIYGVMPN